MPESILLYLNVFPVTVAASTEDSERETSSLFSISRSLPSNGLVDALFAWFALRTHDGSHVNRLRHADHLVSFNNSTWGRSFVWETRLGNNWTAKFSL